MTVARNASRAVTGGVTQHALGDLSFAAWATTTSIRQWDDVELDGQAVCLREIAEQLRNRNLPCCAERWPRLQCVDDIHRRPFLASTDADAAIGNLPKHHRPRFDSHLQKASSRLCFRWIDDCSSRGILSAERVGESELGFHRL